MTLTREAAREIFSELDPNDFDVRTCPWYPEHCIEPSCPACCCHREQVRQEAVKRGLL